MPRTKINKNLASNKRVRDNSADIEEILRGFDVEGKQSGKFVEVFNNSMVV